MDQRGLGTIQEGTDERGMPLEWGRDPDVQAGMRLLNFRNELRQVSFQVESQGQEIGEDYDLADAPGGQGSDGSREVRLAEFQEGRLDVTERTQFCQIASDGADAFVGGFDAGTVSEQDQGGRHGAAPANRETNPNVVRPAIQAKEVRCFRSEANRAFAKSST